MTYEEFFETLDACLNDALEKGVRADAVYAALSYFHHAVGTLVSQDIVNRRGFLEEHDSEAP
jgi:hypothetical protein